jgi:hypothetical protein
MANIFSRSDTAPLSSVIICCTTVITHHRKHILLCYTFKNAVRTSLETHYLSATHLKTQFVPHWKHTTSLLHT